MKRILAITLLVFSWLALSAQDYIPTVNWPYLYPDFHQGELIMVGGTKSKARFNIHLGQGKLHFVNDDGIIGETSVASAVFVRIGEDEFVNIGGRLMKVLARSEKGSVVEETLADYSAVVRQDGAYGAPNANAAQGHSYDENYGNYSYLITNVYADLISQKEYGDPLPVTVNRFFVINGVSMPAAKKSITSMEGVDKKAFAAFLKEEKINWKDPQDMLKVIDYAVR